ncbi:MAG: YCF48-related protein [bacterium]
MIRTCFCLLFISMSLLIRAQWIQVDSIPYGVNKFTGVWFVNDQVGFVVGDAGEILRTTNGGKNWQIRNSGINANLLDVCFSTETTGCAVGAEGMLVFTSDGGNQWQWKNTWTVSDLYSIDFGDTSTGYVVGGQGTLLKTINGGAQWELLSFGDFNAYVEVQFQNATLGFTVKASGIQPNGALLRTTDGAISWEEILTIPAVTALHFSDDQNGFASYTIETGPITETEFYSSVDGGQTWTLENPDCPGFSEIFFVNDSTGYGITYTKIYKTTNRGKTWKAQLSNGSAMFSGLFFVDPYLGFAVGYDGVIYRTTNGGEVGIEDPITNYELRITNYPNPVLSSTTISYCIPTDSHVRINVTNALGTEVARVADHPTAPGRYSLHFDFSDLPPGIYYCSLRTDSGNLVHKMVKL